MEQSGANISTRVGEGDAYVYNWNGVHQTLNQIAQRDYLHERQVKDEYTKAQAQIALHQDKVRPADMPDFQKAYESFKNASLMLQDKRVLKNPELRSQYTQAKDNGYAEALSLAERSKTATDFKKTVYDNAMKDGFLNTSEDFNDKMKMYDDMSVNQLREHNFDNPMNFFNPKDDTPKDEKKLILGDQDKIQNRIPVLDEKGKVKGYNVDEQFAYKTPLSVVGQNALNVLAKSKSLTRETRQEYANGNPEDIATVMDNANKIITQKGGQPLPHDYSGYYAAKWINQAAQTTPAGSKRFEPDQLYMQDQSLANSRAIHNDSERNANARFNKGQAAQDARFNKLHSAASKAFPEIDTTPIYNALKSGDSQLAEKSLNAIAQNNPTQPIVTTISRLDILDPQKRRSLLDKFGISEDEIKYKVGANESEQSKRDRQVAKVIEVINEKSGGNKIKPEDLSRGKIVGAFIHLGKKDVTDPMSGEYRKTTQTRLPVIFNPHTSSPEQFNAEISNEYSTKRKQYLEQQAGALQDAYSEPATAQPDKDPLKLF